MARRKRKLAVKEDFPAWQPWGGLYDDKTAPKVSEKIIFKSADLIEKSR
jgi:hypothetical protein